MSRSESGSKLSTSKILRAGSKGMNFLPFLSMKSSSAPASQRKTQSLRSEEQVRAIRWEERVGRASAKGLTMYMQSFAETILLFFVISLVLNMNVLTKVVPTALSASHPFSKLRNWIVSAATGGADWANISALYAVRPFCGEAVGCEMRGTADKVNGFIGAGLTTAVMRRKDGPVGIASGFAMGFGFSYMLDYFLSPEALNNLNSPGVTSFTGREAQRRKRPPVGSAGRPLK
eukprot:gene26499-34699_t